MIQKLITFLKLLEEEIPPPDRCHHSITYNRYGPFRENPGPEFHDKLSLNINKNGMFITLFFDEGDFEKSPEELVNILKVELDFVERANKV
jgi:hypothetical protein